MQDDRDDIGKVEMERRQELRLEVERTCRVAATALPADGIAGVTANVSRSGMLVKFPGGQGASPLPKVGAAARIVMDLPTSQEYSPRALECAASVVRAVEPIQDAPALAFEIHKMKIRPQRKRSDPSARDRNGLVQ